MTDDNTGWIGVDLDGTLAEYSHWRGNGHIGPPVPRMIQRVKSWLAEGRDVRVFTARVGPQGSPNDIARARKEITAWCLEHIGKILPITAIKDFTMAELWDDRCVQVMQNTGQRADGLEEGGAAHQVTARDAFAKLLGGPLPRSRREYQRTLLMAALLVRQMGSDKPDLLSELWSESSQRTGLRVPTWHGFFAGNRRNPNVDG